MFLHEQISRTHDLLSDLLNSGSGGVEDQEGEGSGQESGTGPGPDLPVQGQGEGEEEEVRQGGAASREQVQGQVHGCHGRCGR